MLRLLFQHVFFNTMIGGANSTCLTYIIVVLVLLFITVVELWGFNWRYNHGNFTLIQLGLYYVRRQTHVCIFRK